MTKQVLKRTEKFWAVTILVTLMSINIPKTVDALTVEPVASNGLQSENNTEFNRMMEFNNAIYAGTRNDAGGAELYRSVDGTSWERVLSGADLNALSDFIDGYPMYTEIMSMAEYEGHLYIGLRSYNRSYPGFAQKNPKLWRSSTGDAGSWKMVKEFSATSLNKIRMLQVFKNQLFVGVGGSDPPQLWKLDSTDWTLINANGFNRTSNDEICNATVFNGSLFIAYANETSQANADILKSNDGINFARPNANPFPDYENLYGESVSPSFVSSLVVFKSALYAGIEEPVTGEDTVRISYYRTGDGANWQRLGGSDLPDNPIFAPLITHRKFSLYAISTESANFEPYGSCDGDTWTNILAENVPNPAYVFVVPELIFNNFIYFAVEIDGAAAEIWRTPMSEIQALLQCPKAGLTALLQLLLTTE